MNELARRKHTIIAITHDPKILKGAHGTIDLNSKPVPKVHYAPKNEPGSTAGQPTAAGAAKPGTGEAAQ
ncbi:MAG: hypothetical protein ACO3MW_03685 [Rhodospirillales bacterium]